MKVATDRSNLKKDLHTGAIVASKKTHRLPNKYEKQIQELMNDVASLKAQVAYLNQLMTRFARKG